MWTPRYLDQKIKQKNIVDLYRGGYSIEEIARKMILTPTSVYRYIKTAGVQLKPRKRDENGRFT
jgi:predicted DNA-binding protein YlxM (UPF0122 family)